MFKTRSEAGRRLAERLADYCLRDPVVYALPRGGAPVAVPFAQAAGAPLDLLFVRKIGAPSEPELALGAVVGGEPPTIERNEEIIRAARVPPEEFDRLAALEIEEIAHRRRRYALPPALAVRGRTAVVMDDGVATGATARAALRSLRAEGASRIIFAAPVAPADAIATLKRFADAVVCLLQPADFQAVGAYYEDFGQVSDEQVLEAIASCAIEARRR